MKKISIGSKLDFIMHTIKEYNPTKIISYNPLAQKEMRYFVKFEYKDLHICKFDSDPWNLINDFYEFCVKYQDQIEISWMEKWGIHPAKSITYTPIYRKLTPEKLRYSPKGDLYRCAPLPIHYPFPTSYAWRQGYWPWYKKTSQIYKVLYPDWIDEFGHKHKGKSKGSKKIWDDTSWKDISEPNKHTFLNKSHRQELRFIARHFSFEEIENAETTNSCRNWIWNQSS